MILLEEAAIDFQRTTAAAWVIFLASWRAASTARTVFSRGLQVEPEPGLRRGADGLAVARFPNGRLVKKIRSIVKKIKYTER